MSRLSMLFFSFLILHFAACRSSTSSARKSILRAQQYHKNLVSHIKMKSRIPTRRGPVVQIVCSQMKILSYFRSNHSQICQKRACDALGATQTHLKSQSVEVIQMETGNAGSRPMQTVSMHVSTVPIPQLLLTLL